MASERGHHIILNLSINMGPRSSKSLDVLKSKRRKGKTQMDPLSNMIAKSIRMNPMLSPS